VSGSVSCRAISRRRWTRICAPLYDALYDLLGFDKTAKMFERQMIEIAPLAYMRGRTLNHAFIILDEAQNTHARADEDVSDADRFWVEGGCHRRHHAGRFAARAQERADMKRSTCWPMCAA